MKRLAGIVVLCFLMCGPAFAQSRIIELDLVKSIKLLESTRDDVVKLFWNAIFPLAAAGRAEDFYTESAVVRVVYSSGDCERIGEVWNVAEGKVIEVIVSPKDFIDVKSLGIDRSNFRREKISRHRKKLLLYADKKAGVRITVDNEKVRSVGFTPPERDYSRLCGKPEVKEYYSSERLIRDPETKNASYHFWPPADVVGLDLSRREVTACGETGSERDAAADTATISVSTKISNIANFSAAYNYYVSGGKTIGRGPQVIWDLSGAKPGIYKITAVADTACGPCGKYITKTVTVKGCDKNSK